MTWIRTVEASEADGELRELYQRVSDPETGQLDHIMQVHSLHPRGLRAHYELYAAVMAGQYAEPSRICRVESWRVQKN